MAAGADELGALVEGCHLGLANYEVFFHVAQVTFFCAVGICLSSAQDFPG